MIKRLTSLFLCVFTGLTAVAQTPAQTESAANQVPPADTTAITVAGVQQIDRVAVVGKRPLVVQRQGRTIVNVDRTILADAGSLTDLRQIRFGVRWNFNNIKSGVRRNQSNAAELSRLQ